MKILLAPAETKQEGGEEKSFCKDNFFLPELFEKREEVLEKYQEYIESLSLEELSKWFGLKNINEVDKYKTNIKYEPTMKAIQRYTGVAFEALDYDNLKKEEQNYVDNNVILFSNLFGPIKANDLIPDYKYKQGSKIPIFKTEKFYKDNFSEDLNQYLGDEIIDLRASFYDKFYSPTQPTITYKFIKDGKVVSHWAKKYRGILVKELAIQNIQNFKELENMKIEGLKLKEKEQKKNLITLVMEII